MATYAIGDIQGCYDTLQALLERIDYRRAEDRLWLVGDLVNRGPRSLDVLRWVVGLGEGVACVLGNHDLHLLARAAGVSRSKVRDTLDEVLSAPDREALLSWLRHRPLLHRDGDWLMVHAGLLPAWGLEEAAALAREAEAMLRGDSWREVLAAWRRKSSQERGIAGESSAQRISCSERVRLTLNVLTRLRMCSPDGRPDFSYAGPPEGAPEGLEPWFGKRRPSEVTVVFGHWAALGRYQQPGFLGLDSGCVWGKSLTAVRLDDGALFHEPAHES